MNASIAIIKNSNPGGLKVMLLSSNWDPDNCINNEKHLLAKRTLKTMLEAKFQLLMTTKINN